jgi:hypothetical protein
VVSTTPRQLYPRETPDTHFTGGWVGPRAVCEKSRPHRDSIPGPSSPQSVAIPTELPGPPVRTVSSDESPSVLIPLETSSWSDTAKARVRSHSVHVRFVVDNVALWRYDRFLSEYIGFPCGCQFTSAPHSSSSTCCSYQKYE